MTSFSIALPKNRAQLLALLREQSGQWLQMFFRHEVLMARGVRAVQIEAVAEFDRLVIRPLLTALPGRIATVTARSGDYTQDLFPELVALRNDVERTIVSGADAVRRLTEERIGEIARQEVRWVGESMQKLDPKFGAGLEPESPPIVNPAVVEKALRDKVWLGDSTEKWFAKDLAGKTSDDVRQWITTGVKRGLSVDAIVRELRGTKKDAGILAEKPVHRLRALVRTAATHASSVGQIESHKALGVTHVRWISVLDHRTSLTCMALDGSVFPIGEGPEPPLHPNCFPGDTLVTTGCRVSGVTKRWFDGEVAVIRTASGRVLTGTPNHPILTDCGWVGIGALAVGDHVVCDGGRQWRGYVDGDNENVPTSIHEVAEAFFASREVVSCPVPVSAPHFHGDATDGQVAVVGADRRLRPWLHAALTKHRDKMEFVDADLLGSAGGASLQLLDGVALAANGSMGGGRLLKPLLRSSAGHASDLLCLSIPRLAPIGAKDPVDDAGRVAAEVLGDPPNADAIIEHSEACRGVEYDPRHRASAAHLHATLGQAPIHDAPADEVLAREILAGRAGIVFPDEIVDVEVRQFSGHVFNLETEGGFYSADGIVVHNCRSVLAPVVGSPDGERFGTRATIKGPVHAKVNFEEWLGRLSTAEQDQILGRTRAVAWRDGDLKLADMLGKDLQPLPLAELRRLDRL